MRLILLESLLLLTKERRSEIERRYTSFVLFFTFSFHPLPLLNQARTIRLFLEIQTHAPFPEFNFRHVVSYRHKQLFLFIFSVSLKQFQWTSLKVQLIFIHFARLDVFITIFLFMHFFFQKYNLLLVQQLIL